MSSNDVRKGMTNAQFNEKQSGILMTEIFIIAVVCGLYFTSWWVFGGVLLGLLIGLFIPQVAIPFIILLSVGWGLLDMVLVQCLVLLVLLLYWELLVY